MSLEVREVNSYSRDFPQLKDWRKRYIGDNPAKERNFEHLESVRDTCSYSFAFYSEGKLAGGVRFTPVGHGLTVGEHLVGLNDLFSDMRRLLDVNRLVLDEAMRGGDLVSKALRHCFRWARDNTVHERLIAVCAPRLVPLYRRVGATVIKTDIQSPTVEGKTYCLLTLKLGDLR